MDTQRVLLLCAQPLFGEGLEAMLSQLENVEPIGPWAPGPQILAQLSLETPDIILIVEAEHEDWTSLTTQILEQCSDLPVIRIQSRENAVRLYTSRALPPRIADVLETIQDLATAH